MPRTLRLGFAMGGGVSLGTFSGAALSEAIKLAILRGVHEDSRGNQQPYDRVEIDVFSGASAGAMALALMLRGAAHQTKTQRDGAEARLRDQFGAEATRLKAASPEKYKDLIVAQVVQDLQERAWKDEVTLEGLLGRTPGAGASGRRDLTYGASLLDRREVDRIARLLLDFGPEAQTDGGSADLSSPRLLARRVLFACSLSNVSPILIDARRQFADTDAGFVGLGDGATSKVHRELRVFDLHFGDLAAADPRLVCLGDACANPRRWCRYHTGDELEGGIGDLRLRKTWAKIGATAVACGAFPFAFEPVVLRRSRWEFGPDWPRQLEDWPDEKYPFTYIDGGVFNNEPIREAFRLAGFIDGSAAGAAAAEGRPAQDHDRRIIFVDPFVETGEPSLRVGLHQEFAVRQRRALGVFSGFDLVRRASLDRLAPQAGAVLGAVFNESRVIEADKVYQTRDNFALRNRLRVILADAVAGKPSAKAFKSLMSFCDGILGRDAEDDIIPAGPLTLASELERVIAEERGDLASLAGKGARFVASSKPASDPDGAKWFRALVCVAVDQVMRLSGKNERGLLIAIGPFEQPQNRRDPRPIKLPGGMVQGFGGFTSKVNRAYEIDAGRFCAARYLEVCALIKPPARPLTLRQWSPQEDAQFKEDLRHGLAALAARAAQAVKDSSLVSLGIFTDVALSFIGGFIEKKIAALADEKPATRAYEFRIVVPDGSYEFDGPGLGGRDVSAIDDPGDPSRKVLITTCDLGADSGLWSGAHVDVPRQLLPVDTNGPLGLADSRFCDIELPTPEEVRPADLLPHPIFELTLTKKDRGQRVPRARWTLVRPGVVSLEETLFPR
jgi:predicted acylesterase/phospholipase RssA